MPILTAENSFPKEHIPPGTYKATITGIRQGQIRDFNNPEEMKDVLFWAFEIKGKSRTVTLEGMTTMAFGEKSKARKWTIAVLGAEPPRTFDTDDLVDSQCRVIVIDKESEGEKFSKVDSVISASEGEL